MGANGSGSITKLASNQLWAIHATAMGEALVMAIKSGVDVSRAWDALKIGASDS
jgi:3-hydroxyisobutyrate dehydrogenase